MQHSPVSQYHLQVEHILTHCSIPAEEGGRERGGGEKGERKEKEKEREGRRRREGRQGGGGKEREGTTQNWQPTHYTDCNIAELLSNKLLPSL